MNIYQLLKGFRHKKGLTQKEVAEKIHVKHNTYNQYENEKRKIDIETFVRIADELDIEIMAFSPKSEIIDRKYTMLLNLNDESFKTWINHVYDNELLVYSLIYLDKKTFEEFVEKMNSMLSNGRLSLIYDMMLEMVSLKKENNSKLLRKSQYAREELLQKAECLIEEKKIENVFNENSN